MSVDSGGDNRKIPRILITPGEPAGIGPELLVQLADQPFPAQLLLLADPQTITRAATQINRAVEVELTSLDAPRQQHTPGTLQVVSHSLASANVLPGTPQADNAGTLIKALQTACEQCLSNNADALVTGPLDKAVINQAGIPFSGHTEYLAQATRTADVVMLLAARHLKVALLTTHLPLKQVAAAVTRETLIKQLRIIHREMKRLYRLSNPRIAVCGLNPHAGEGGYLGEEEQTIIEPVLAELRQQGMSLLGPLPADSAFTPTALSRCDLVLAMYHDQGLPPLKQVADQDAVNSTLGLPIIRVSVDHGTAYDLAGSGRASAASMKRAIRTAIEFSDQQ